MRIRVLIALCVLISGLGALVVALSEDPCPEGYHFATPECRFVAEEKYGIKNGCVKDDCEVMHALWCTDDQTVCCNVTIPRGCFVEGTQACLPGEILHYRCPDGTLVPWCFCTYEQGTGSWGWTCIISPELQCEDYQNCTPMCQSPTQNRPCCPPSRAVPMADPIKVDGEWRCEHVDMELCLVIGDGICDKQCGENWCVSRDCEGPETKYCTNPYGKEGDQICRGRDLYACWCNKQCYWRLVERDHPWCMPSWGLEKCDYCPGEIPPPGAPPFRWCIYRYIPRSDSWVLVETCEPDETCECSPAPTKLLEGKDCRCVEEQLPPECSPGEKRDYICPDGTPVPWCYCTTEEEWECILNPEEQCPTAGMVSSLEVYVYDEATENPIEDAVVRVVQAPTEGQYEDFEPTDRRGIAKFYDLPRGEYTIEAEKDGYDPASKVGTLDTVEESVEIGLKPIIWSRAWLSENLGVLWGLIVFIVIWVSVVYWGRRK